MVTDIVTRGLDWLGHLIRTESNRIPIVSLGVKLEAKNTVGRPKLRWLDDLQADLQTTRIKAWRRKAQDRSEWMDVKRKAKVELQHAPHNDVWVNDRPHIRRWSHKIIIL